MGSILIFTEDKLLNNNLLIKNKNELGIDE